MLLDNPVIEVMSDYPANSVSGQLIILQDRGLRYFDEGRWKSGHNDFDYAAITQFAGDSTVFSPTTKLTVRALHISNISGVETTVSVRLNNTSLLHNVKLGTVEAIQLEIAIPMQLGDTLHVEAGERIACSIIGSDADDYELVGVGANLNIVSTWTSVVTFMVLCNTGESATTATVKFCFNGVDSDAAIFCKDIPLEVGQSIFGDIKHVLPAGGRLIVEGEGVHALFSGGVYG